MSPKPHTSLIPLEKVDRRILLIRGQKVILDYDLAELYGVTTKRLNEQVKRNSERFPKHFMFQLTNQEFENWRSQIATSNPGAKMGLRRPPYAFTEHGTLQAANVLNSTTAIKVSIIIIEAFIKLREFAASHNELFEKTMEHEKQIGYLFQLLKELAATPEPASHYSTRRIGFTRDEEPSGKKRQKKA